MNSKLVEKVEDFIFDLTVKKVAKAFENVRLSYGTLVDLPELTQDDLAVLSQFGKWAIEYAQENYNSILGEAVSYYLYEVLRIDEVPNEYYEWHLIKTKNGSTQVLIDLDVESIMDDYKVLNEYPLVVKERGQNGRKRYFIEKETPGSFYTSLSYWVEVTEEEALKKA